MTTYVLLHGAGGRGSDWDLVAPFLRGAGGDVIAVDLPCDQPVGLGAYADAVVEAIAASEVGDEPVVLVAQSLSGFVAPLVCARVPVARLVLVAAMIPRPGETGGEWWEVTGHAAALQAQGLEDTSPEALFLHDVPDDVLAAIEAPRDQTDTLFDEPWPLATWPDVPTDFLLCADDRFSPAAWSRALVVDRLAIEPVEVPGGHCAHLSQPRALAEAVLACSSTLR